MPLNPALLHDPCLKLFKECTPDPAKTAKVMSDGYEAYTAGALFAGIPPTFTGIEKTVMKGTILAVLNPLLMNPAALATAWSAGITAWWLAPPIIVGPGLVTACPGALPLLPALTAIFSIPGQPAEVAAAVMTAAIDVATRTTIATILGAPTPII